MSDSGTSDDDITADDPLLTLAATLVDDTPLAPYSPPSSDRGSPSSPMLLERKSALERRKRLAARAALSEPGMLEALLQPTALQSWLPPSSPLKEIAEVLREAAAEEEREDKGAGGAADGFTSRLPVAWQTAGLLKGVIALLDAPQAVALLRTASAVATKRMVGDAACAEAFALTPPSRRVFQPKGRNASPKYFAVGAGKADNRSSPLSAGASSFSPNRSGGGAGGGKREWKSPLLGD